MSRPGTSAAAGIALARCAMFMKHKAPKLMSGVMSIVFSRF
jgi:hypothetical protein